MDHPGQQGLAARFDVDDGPMFAPAPGRPPTRAAPMLPSISGRQRRGKKYTAHNANEYNEVSDLGADVQMFNAGSATLYGPNPTI